MAQITAASNNPNYCIALPYLWHLSLCKWQIYTNQILMMNFIHKSSSTQFIIKRSDGKIPGSQQISFQLFVSGAFRILAFCAKTEHLILRVWWCSIDFASSEPSMFTRRSFYTYFSIFFVVVQNSWCCSVAGRPLSLSLCSDDPICSASKFHANHTAATNGLLMCCMAHSQKHISFVQIILKVRTFWCVRGHTKKKRKTLLKRPNILVCMYFIDVDSVYNF